MTNLTRQRGRQLTSLQKGTTAVSYVYNSDGLRAKKTVGSTVTSFSYNDMGLLAKQTTGANKLIFFYDNAGNIKAMEYNGTRYFLRRNAQGDVIALLLESGAVVANYSYDAWGKLLSVTDSSGNAITSTTHIANINPIRYRGYYYDTETGFYYLSSRYYDPETCRFINADAYVSTGQGVLSYNMFAYCLNNPVNMVDQDGTMAAAIAVSSSTFAAFTAWLSTIGSANFWNPVGWVIAGVLAAGVITWAAVSLYNTYQREHAKTVSKAATKVKTTVKQRSRTRYWTATVQSDYVDIGRALTYSQAVKEVQAGRSVFAVTWYEAKAVAIAAGGTSGRNNKNLYPEIDKGKENTPGYYYHYHTYNRRGGHVYYLF